MEIFTATQELEEWTQANAEALIAAVELSIGEGRAVSGVVASDIVVEGLCKDLRSVAALAREVAEGHKSDILRGRDNGEGKNREGKGGITKLDKQKYGDFMLVSKRATSAVFPKQGRLLAVVKALKKLH